MQTAAPTSLQATTPIPGVSVAPISTAPQVSLPIPQVYALQSGPIVHTTVHMPAVQPVTSTVITSQPQFVYPPYQGQYQYGPVAQNPVYQHQPYPGYTYQIPTQPQYGPVNPGFPRGVPVPNA